ncbi:S8 family serine peptidase [Nostoc sp. CENA67]|uniref:S8 family serine peptidase n=1 Tax=Amazonocrinis nigriterrae CENA67 TaxID=2794033 RepID=A0A8J7HUR6_9NOST|nr:S8 family serine peptidase [Amazonocrinis nigriterrae]MBH8565942.1 S8 family serine peptidase [Amazonocrinis nigriterrae CENA67]
MKRITSGILLTACIWSGLGMFSIPPQVTAVAQTQEGNDLFYMYKGQRIPLNQRQDAIAVSFKKVATRGIAAQPLYLQLQESLKGGVRGGNSPTVSPLGENYAVVNLPTQVPNVAATIQQRIQQQPYVENTLPVLTRRETKEVIILPNEIIVSFEPKVSPSQRQAILQQNNLAIVRPLRFNRDRYLVKSTAAAGTQILNVANQLYSVKGVTSAAPNFIQSVRRDWGSGTKDWELGKSFLNTQSPIPNSQSPIPNTRAISVKSNLLGLAWHLDSEPLKQCLSQPISGWESLQNCLQHPTANTKSTVSRTDIRVTDAWKHSNGGRGVVVAVLDSLIQWDHPDLAGSLYTVKAADKCPNEIHGWDFSSGGNSLEPCEIGDGDTRISRDELAILKARFQDTFKLSDAELVQQYPEEASEVKQNKPDYSVGQIAEALRYVFRTYKVGGEFHGTWVSGVIAAKSQNNQGLVGVAPNAQILPVRLFGLNGSYSPSAYIEAIGYASDRGADIINLSLGSTLPTEGEEQAIADILKANPKLVIVASAGNENSNQVAYPAAYPGVVAVGATNILGNRAPYSNYGKGLDVVAPGGDFDTPGFIGGIPTTGGTWLDAFWQGIPKPNSRWSSVLDERGKYWWVQGTSFSAPAVAGVVALMKGENKQIPRERLVSILKSTASYEWLNISEEDARLYRSQRRKGAVSSSVKGQEYFFGKGLVNADAAVQAVK